MPTMDDLKEWFTYHAPDEKQRRNYEVLRIAGAILAEKILRLCPPCADTTAAIRKVREAIMTANAAIACAGASEDQRKAGTATTFRTQILFCGLCGAKQGFDKAATYREWTCPTCKAENHFGAGEDGRQHAAVGSPAEAEAMRHHGRMKDCTCGKVEPWAPAMGCPVHCVTGGLKVNAVPAPTPDDPKTRHPLGLDWVYETAFGPIDMDYRTAMRFRAVLPPHEAVTYVHRKEEGLHL